MIKEWGYLFMWRNFSSKRFTFLFCIITRLWLVSALLLFKMLDKQPDQDMKGFPKGSNIVAGKNKWSQKFIEHCSSEWYPKALGKWGSIFRVSLGWGRKTGGLMLFLIYSMIFCWYFTWYSAWIFLFYGIPWIHFDKRGFP